MTTQKYNRCENCRNRLPQGKLNSWVYCKECPSSEWSDYDEMWRCLRYDRWESRNGGCSESPKSQGSGIITH